MQETGGRPRELKFAVIADDLTGAAASAACLAHHLGHPVPVVTDRDPMPPGPLVVNTETRERPQPGRVAALVRELWRKGYRRLDKRVDSTLRGPVLAELGELREALGVQAQVVAVPAYPRAGRHTVAGRQQWAFGSQARILGAVGEVLFGNEPHDLVRVEDRSPDDILAMLVSAAAGLGRTIVDISTEDELSRVGIALSRWDTERWGPLVTVSSGALLRFYPIRPRRTAAVLIGSQTELAHAQATQLVASGFASLYPLGEAAVLPNRPWIVWEGHSLPSPAGRESEVVAALAVARLGDLRSQGWQPDSIVLVGGETAQAFLKAAGARAVDIGGTPYPLVARGRIAGGILDGTVVWTKGGWVGGPESLLEILSGC